MSTSTVTGSGTLTTLALSNGTNLVVPQFQYVSLLQGADVTFTALGNTVLLLGRVETTNDAQCSVEIDIDGANVYTDGAGLQIITRLPLTAGSHTLTFKAFGLANDVLAEVFGLTIVDLGI